MTVVIQCVVCVLRFGSETCFSGFVINFECMHLNTCSCLHIYICAHMCIHIYLYIHIHMHIYIYIYVFLYTYFESFNGYSY
jgi:hypothetical protein